MTADRNDPHVRVERIMNRLLSDQRFYGLVLLDTKVHVIPCIPPHIGPDTACTDGINMWISENFINEISDDTLKFIYKHEVVHKVHRHPMRCKHRDPHKWNVAIDAWTNDLLKKGGDAVPESGVLDPRYTSDMLEENIYEIIDPNLVKKFQQPTITVVPFGSLGKDGEEVPTPGEYEARLRSIIERAVAEASKAGKLPGWAEEFMVQQRECKVPWFAKLMRYLSQLKQSDLSWKRVARKPFATGLYLPDDIDYGLGTVVFMIDTSGSMINDWVNQGISELNGIFQAFPGSSVYSLYFDAEVWHFAKTESLETPTKFHRGGTSFKAAFDHVAKENIKPDVCIMFTDLECDFPDKPPYPVIFVSPKNHQVPWGEVIRYE